MKKLIVPIAFLLLILSISACSKKEIEPPSNFELLTASKWKINKWTVEPGIPDPGTQEIVTDVTHMITPCYLDDAFEFGTEYNYQVESGNEKCYQDEPNISSQGTWDIGESGTKLYLQMELSNFTTTYEIKKLNSGDMQLSYEILYGNEFIELTEHYVHEK